MGRLTEVKELIDLHVELFIDLGLRVTFGRLTATTVTQNNLSNVNSCSALVRKQVEQRFVWRIIANAVYALVLSQKKCL